MIALRVDSEAELLQLVAAADVAGLGTYVVQDAGRTQVAHTCRTRRARRAHRSRRERTAAARDGSFRRRRSHARRAAR